MKVAKALKEKNRLVGEIEEFKALIAQQNVRPDGREFDYNNHELLAQLRSRLEDLIKLKTKLATVNVTIYQDVFRLAELKGLVASLRRVEVKDGIFHEALGGFHSENVEVRYRSQLGRREIDVMVKELENEMAEVQDRLDDFNATASLEP
ncbi:MAG: hypothetical protein ACFCU3_08200 [Verrucomicrobiales bacterium]